MQQHAAKKQMNIVLQNKGSLQFVGSSGSWTPHGENAQIFPNGLTAMMYCLHWRLPHIQIVARFGNPQFNFAVPVTDIYGA
jgi:hypothetical protein